MYLPPPPPAIFERHFGIGDASVKTKGENQRYETEYIPRCKNINYIITGTGWKTQVHERLGLL